MSGVRSAIRKLSGLRKAIPTIAEDSIQETSGDFIAINQEQMLLGIDRYGNRLGTYKNPDYAVMKHNMNPLAGLGNKDFRLTGAYYRGWFAVVDGAKIRMGSTDEKAPSLEKNGDPRYGLTPESQAKYVNGHLRPVFNQKVRDKLRS